MVIWKLLRTKEIDDVVYPSTPSAQTRGASARITNYLPHENFHTVAPSGLSTPLETVLQSASSSLFFFLSLRSSSALIQRQSEMEKLRRSSDLRGP